VDAFMAMTKRYSGSLRLGEGTPSYDAETPVEERLPWQHVTDDDLLRARDGLLGDIQQLPPMYSAIKVGRQAADPRWTAAMCTPCAPCPGCCRPMPAPSP
jgi:tRNA pseudouridine55 synthase